MSASISSRATSLIENARSVAVSICYCRHKAQHLGKVCDAPKEICLTLNAGADFVIRRKFGRRINNCLLYTSDAADD